MPEKRVAGEPPSADQAIIGLRERKKVKTRAAIQRQALKLFRRQGYDATTVEQIAAAAEISPSTFFRYFPTKEDVVFADEFDPLLMKALEAQDPGTNPVRAWRNAFRSVFGSLSPGQMAVERERYLLIMAVPELRAATLDQMAQGMRTAADLVARTTGHDSSDLAVRALVGAVIGVWMSVLFAWAENPIEDIVKSMDKAMAHLEAGLSL